MAKQKTSTNPQTSEAVTQTLPPALADAVKTNVSARIATVIEEITGARIDRKSFRDRVRKRYGFTSGKHGEASKFVWNDEAAAEMLAHYADKVKQA